MSGGSRVGVIDPMVLYEFQPCFGLHGGFVALDCELLILVGQARAACYRKANWGHLAYASSSIVVLFTSHQI
jgi:hypothetical protein